MRGAGLALFAMLALPVEALGSFAPFPLPFRPHDRSGGAAGGEPACLNYGEPPGEHFRVVTSPDPSLARPNPGAAALPPTALETNEPPKSP